MVGGGLEDSEAFDVIPIFAPFSHEKLATQAKLLWTRACDKIRENHEEKVGSRAATSVFGRKWDFLFCTTSYYFTQYCQINSSVCPPNQKVL